MKKFIALLFCAAFLFSLAACNEAVNNESLGAESEINSAVSDISVEESTEASVEESVEESTEASDEASTEESVVEDENVTESFKIGENTLNIISDEETGYTKLSVTYADSTKQTLCEDYNVYDISASPDNKHLFFCVYEWEEYGDLYLLNFESKKLTKLPLYDAEKDRIPYQAIWLDNEYIVYSDKMHAGTVAIGGDVFVYNIVSGTNKKIIATPADARLQITDILADVSGFQFACGYYDEHFNEYEKLNFDLSLDRVKELIGKEEAITVEYSNGQIKEVTK